MKPSTVPFVLASVCGTIASVVSATANCYHIPGDPGWPSTREWAALNKSVGGRLIENVPLPQICHKSGFDTPECKQLREQWIYTEPHFMSSVSVMSPLFINNTCVPYADVNPDHCTLGNLASYSVNVSSAADAIAGAKFAKRNNIRLVVKNTGHDFLGRSTGKGALSLWTHNLKEATYIDNYQSSAYNGPAFRFGAGIQGWEANDAAAAKHKQVVTGYCPTVGIIGGYSQTGGFGPLSASYGLAADNVLELDVVTVDGRNLRASETENPDLFWALRGGGGGTFGIVLSAVYKAHEDTQVAGGYLQVNHTQSDEFWNLMVFVQQQHLEWNNVANLTILWQIFSNTFTINFVSWPRHTKADLEQLFNPLFSYLHKHQFSYNWTASTEPGFHEHFAKYVDGFNHGEFNINEVITSRFMPRRVLEKNVTNLTNLIRKVIASDDRFIVGAVGTNVSHANLGKQLTDNAVMPAWRDVAFYMYSQATWDPESPLDELYGLLSRVNDDVRPGFRALTPGGGAYMNENTYNNPTWKEDFFGSNYDRLLRIKRAYDPSNLLYSRPSVGHEYFEQLPDGRICRK